MKIWDYSGTCFHLAKVQFSSKSLEILSEYPPKSRRAGRRTSEHLRGSSSGLRRQGRCGQGRCGQAREPNPAAPRWEGLRNELPQNEVRQGPSEQGRPGNGRVLRPSC